MTQTDQLNTVIATMQSDFTKYRGDVGAKLKGFQDQMSTLQQQLTDLQNQPGTGDLTSVLATADALDADIKAADAELVNPAPAPAPTA